MKPPRLRRQWRWPSAPAQGKAKAFFVDREVHPQTPWRCCAPAPSLSGWNLIVGDPLVDLEKAEVVRRGCCNILLLPGAVRDLRGAIANAGTPKARLFAIVAAEPAWR